MSGLVEQGRGAGSFPGAVTPTPTLLSHLLSVTQTLGWGCGRCQGGLCALGRCRGLRRVCLHPELFLINSM